MKYRQVTTYCGVLVGFKTLVRYIVEKALTLYSTLSTLLKVPPHSKQSILNAMTLIQCATNAKKA